MIDRIIDDINNNIDTATLEYDERKYGGCSGICRIIYKIIGKYAEYKLTFSSFKKIHTIEIKSKSKDDNLILKEYEGDLTKIHIKLLRNIFDTCECINEKNEQCNKLNRLTKIFND